MPDIKTCATEVFDTVQTLHDVVGDTPEMVAHHAALNRLRQLLISDWPEFLAFIGRQEPAARTFSGGTNKDEPPPPGGK